jgi:hypothetical protein
MLANTPWSGYYEVSEPIWVSAHLAQFAQPGWRYLLPGQGSGLLPPGDQGCYVALVAPGGPAQGFTLVVETMGKPGGTYTFALSGGLPGPGTALHVWQTTQVLAVTRAFPVGQGRVLGPCVPVVQHVPR